MATRELGEVNWELRRLCRQISAATAFLALAGVMVAWLWTGENGWLMLACGIVLVAALGAALDALSRVCLQRYTGELR